MRSYLNLILSIFFTLFFVACRENQTEEPRPAGSDVARKGVDDRNPREDCPYGSHWDVRSGQCVPNEPTGPDCSYVTDATKVDARQRAKSIAHDPVYGGYDYDVVSQYLATHDMNVEGAKINKGQLPLYATWITEAVLDGSWDYIKTLPADPRNMPPAGSPVYVYNAVSHKNFVTQRLQRVVTLAQIDPNLNGDEKQGVYQAISQALSQFQTIVNEMNRYDSCFTDPAWLANSMQTNPKFAQMGFFQTLIKGVKKFTNIVATLVVATAQAAFLAGVLVISGGVNILKGAFGNVTWDQIKWAAIKGAFKGFQQGAKNLAAGKWVCIFRGPGTGCAS